VSDASLSDVQIDMSVIFRISTHLFFQRAEFKDVDALFYGTDPGGNNLDYLLIEINAGGGVL